jgi:lipase chaperone LimK
VKARRAALIAVTAAAAGLGGWWALQQPQAAGSAASRQDGGAAFASVPATANAQASAAARLAQSAGTPAPADPFLAADLRHKLEAMLLEAGDVPSPAALKQRVAGLVARYFSASEATRALALAERYVDYRVALGEIKPPADPSDPRALRAAVEARQRIREQHFAGEEYQALFAQEEELDRFTVARLEIERNAGLTPAQKQAAVKDAERELSDAQRAARSDAVAHVAVAAQTAAFEAQGVSEQARYAQRRAQYGDAAAQQLAQLDREDRDWQQRLSQYAAARDAKASESQLQQLRRQLFSPEEQMRIEAALLARRAQ